MANALQPHPLCLLLPEMEQDQYESLKASIGQRGVREPIVLLDGQILDGRHRYRAGKELGLGVPAREFDAETDGESAANFVLDQNVNRRSLTASQRAQIAAEFLPFYEAEAKARLKLRKPVSKADAPTKGAVPAPPPPDEVVSAGGEVRGKAAERAAKATGATPRMVELAKQVSKASPELASQVKAGKISVTAAQRKLSAPPPPPDEVPASATKASLALTRSGDFQSLVRQIHAARRAAEELAATEIGAELRIKQIRAHLDSAAAAVRFAIPFRTCPYKPACAAGQCKACAGREWVTEEVWNRLPPEVKG